MRAKFKFFRHHTDGNVAVLTALCLSAVMLCVGAALDISRLHQVRQNLQDMSDSAALMAVVGSDGSKSDVKKVAKAAVDELSISMDKDITLKKTKASLDNDIVSVLVTAEVPLMFGGVIGKKDMEVVAASRATGRSGGDFPETSIAFVLDASGSMNAAMGSTTRISALKSGVTDLFDEIETHYNQDDDLSTSLRTGVYSYNWGIRDDYSAEISEGWTKTVGAVQSMRLGSATIPAQAMEAALKDLRNEPKSSDGRDRNKFLVFMTDGEVDDHLNMNGKSSKFHSYGRDDDDDDDDDDDYDDDRDDDDWDDDDDEERVGKFTKRTLNVCRKAQSKGITIIAISMDAPKSSRQLLQDCVSNGQLPSSYYANTSTDEAFDRVLEKLLPTKTVDSARLID